MYSHSHSAVGERLATEGVVHLERVLVVDRESIAAIGECARTRRRLGRILHHGFAEVVLEARDKSETRYPWPRSQPVQNFESSFGGIDFGRRLREHLGNFAAPRERVLEIAR